MAVLRSRNKVILVKVEGTSGTDSSPVVATDALLVDSIDVTPKANVLQSNELRGTLDAGIPTIGITPVDIKIVVPLKASGAAGTAPETQPLLLACGLAETTQVAIGPTTATGGTGTTFTIDTGAAPTWPTTTAAGTALLGLVVSLSGNPATAALATIVGYTVSAGIATVTLSRTFSPVLSSSTIATVQSSVRYQPSSAEPPSVTIYDYIDGILWKIVAVRGEMEMALKSGEKGMLTFTMSGLYHPTAPKTDVALPANSTVIVDSSRPPVWKNGQSTVGSVLTCMRDFSLKLGNKIAYPSCPNAVEGIDPPEITARDMTGTANAYETLVATRNAFADFRAETKRPITAIVGTVAGNRVGASILAAMYTSETESDDNGFVGVSLPFSATGTDNGFQLAFF